MSASEQAKALRRQAEMLDEVAKAERKLLSAKESGERGKRYRDAKDELRAARAKYRSETTVNIGPGDAVAMPAPATNKGA